jgi:hypothetical protein
MFGFGKSKRKVTKKSVLYSVMEVSKGGTRGRLIHIHMYGTSAPKSKAQSMAKSMRETSGDRFNYRVIRAKQ